MLRPIHTPLGILTEKKNKRTTRLNVLAHFEHMNNKYTYDVLCKNGKCRWEYKSKRA